MPHLGVQYPGMVCVWKPGRLLSSGLFCIELQPLGISANLVAAFVCRHNLLGIISIEEHTSCLSLPP